MRIDDATLMAFLAGDLPTEEYAHVEAALEDDPKLAARLQRIRGVRTALRSVYDSVVEEPIPEHLRALLGDVASSEPPASAPPADPPPPRRAVRWAPLIAAAAAGLIIGVLAASVARFGGGELASRSDGLHAEGALAQALDQQLSTDDSGVSIGFSFRAEGRVCRTFVYAARSYSGFACRTGEGWSVRALHVEPGAASVAPAILASVDVIIDGEPLNPDVERALREAGWRE
ncbi:MAG: anti-sigma factor [Hyphomonadaceae bacterium]